MGRPPKTDRFDTDTTDEDEREQPRESTRRAKKKDFERDMFADEIASPFHIPREVWPDGMALRWISIEVTGAPDNRNWSVKTAARWTPVARGKYPNIDARIPSIPMPGFNNAAGGNIIYGGLCLCERDIRLNHREKAAQEKATDDANRTIESYVEGGNPTVPRFNQSSPVQFERGRPAAFKE